METMNIMNVILAFLLMSTSLAVSIMDAKVREVRKRREELERLRQEEKERDDDGA